MRVGEQTHAHSPRSVAEMNWNLSEGNWRQLTTDLKRRWGTLKDAQLDLWTGQHRRPKQVAGTQARPQEIEPPK
jgi:hypothetical protein